MNMYKRSTLLHTVIAFVIMFFFRFLPISLPQVTDVGMAVIGVFIGTIYMWITIEEPIWTSVISMVMLVYAGYFSMNEMLTTYWGNSIVLMTLFLMLMSNALDVYGVTPHLSRFLVSLKIVRGRPYMLMFVIGIASFFLGAFVSSAAPLFIFWPVLSNIYKEAGYEKGETFPAINTIYLLVCALLGMPVTPYKSNPLVIINQFRTIIENNESDMSFQFVDSAYMGVVILLCILIQILIVLIVRFVFRPDVEKLKKLDYNEYDSNPLPPLTVSQKILSAGFILMILAMLMPSLITSVPFFAALGNLTLGIPMIFAGVLAAIPAEKKPVISIPRILGQRFQWGQVFMVGAAIVISSALTDSSTGVSAMLLQVLSPIMTGLSTAAFTIVLLIILCVLTNILNSLVVAMVIEPIVFTFCSTTGVNPVPILSLLIAVCFGTAIITPSASPFAALLHGNKEWTEAKDIYKYTALFVVVELVIFIAIGIPLMNLAA